jgi:hypothetical protein
MVSPSQRPEAVMMIRDRLKLSERRACEIVGHPRCTQRHEPKVAADGQLLRRELRRISAEHKRWGYQPPPTANWSTNAADASTDRRKQPGPTCLQPAGCFVGDTRSRLTIAAVIRSGSPVCPERAESTFASQRPIDHRTLSRVKSSCSMPYFRSTAASFVSRFA